MKLRWLASNSRGTRSAACFQGLFAAAKKYYLLFQQQTTDAYDRKHPGDFLGAHG